MTLKTLWLKLNSPLSKQESTQGEKMKSRLFGMTAGLAVGLFIIFVIIPFGLLALVFGWLHLAGY